MAKLTTEMATMLSDMESKKQAPEFGLRTTSASDAVLDGIERIQSSCTTTRSSEECTLSSPLYSIRPSLRNLFMK